MSATFGFVFAEDVSLRPNSVEEVVADFEAAAPGLHKIWMESRPNTLATIQLGVRREYFPCKAGGGSFFEFVTCIDDTTPDKYSIDVLQSQSVLYPFKGIIKIPVSESCRLTRVVPDGLSWSAKKVAAIAPYCEGKPLSECLASGGQIAPGLVGAACTGGPGVSFHYDGTTTLEFAWSKGSWDFQKQTGDPEFSVPGRR